MESWPAIDEPSPWVTVDLAPVFSGGYAQFSAGEVVVNSLTLSALGRLLGQDDSVIVLDWQHQSYRFRPHVFACRPEQKWATPVVTDGDYYIFLTEDMSTGTSGHPWERTLCVFGEPLVSILVPMLAGWLPVKRRRGR